MTAQNGSLAETVLAATWETMNPAPPLYDIEAAQLSEPPFERGTRRNAVAGLREDTLTVGRFDDGRPHLVVALERGTIPRARLGLFVDLTRRAAPAGLAILRMGGPETIGTKFGDVEAATTTLAGGHDRACLVFRWSEPEQGFGFKGWYCPAEPAKGRSELICLLDGLGATPIADRPLRVWFAQLDARRSPACRLPSPAFASRSSLR